MVINMAKTWLLHFYYNKTVVKKELIIVMWLFAPALQFNGIMFTDGVIKMSLFH